MYGVVSSKNVDFRSARFTAEFRFFLPPPSYSILLYLQVCRIQDESITKGRVKGKNRIHAEGLHYMALEKKRRLGLEVCRLDEPSNPQSLRQLKRFSHTLRAS
jgi:hypothetical protein